MNKKFAIICSMLLAASMNIKALNFEVQVPIKFFAGAENTNKLYVEFPTIKSDFDPGLRNWIVLPQLAAMFDPENPKDIVFVDVKSLILKIVAQNPEIIEKAGINLDDFIRAGISEEDLKSMEQEVIRPEEISLLSQIFNDLLHGDSSRGLEHIWGGGIDVARGGAKFGLGSVILLRKATVAVAKFFYDNILPRVADNELENKPNS